LPDSLIRGRVTEVGIAAVGTTYPVTVVVTGDCPQIRSGMAADVRFRLPLEGGTRQIVVPPVSVGEDREGNYVYVLEADDQDQWFAHRRSVEVGGILAEGLLIATGLSEGELIATAGVRRISEGMQVRLMDQNKP
ncbi:MAG: efflux RND transporter periplasmic adaptor subunit, partial [Gammaproteobacteria bacterium]|nr:efflux RND transporter periplasmic adaptor subunit [Gammaproteobacteria bacterium]